MARRLASLRSFFRYLRRQGLVGSDPSVGLRNPKQARRLPRLLRVDEVIRLLDAVPIDTPPGVRDRAMLETLYGGGLRVSELVGLNLDDLDLEARVGSSPRQGPPRAALPDRSDGACTGSGAGFRSASPSSRSEKALFLNQRGTRLSTRSVGRLLEAHLLRGGLVNAASPHTLRT